MDTLADSLLAEGRRDAVITDCADLIEAHVRGLRGLKGIALRTAFTMLRGGDPNAVHNALASLIPEFVHSFEPLYQKFRKKPGHDFSAFLQSQRKDAVAAMLSVTDTRFNRSKNATLKAAYPKVRGTIENELDTVLPGLADLLQRHLDD